MVNVGDLSLLQADFRGVTAPASLKLLQRRDRYQIKTVFPGCNRPGLIEAWFWRQCFWYGPSFPGCNRPGLIEARTASEAERVGRSISGV